MENLTLRWILSIRSNREWQSIGLCLASYCSVGADFGSSSRGLNILHFPVDAAHVASDDSHSRQRRVHQQCWSGLYSHHENLLVAFVFDLHIERSFQVNQQIDEIKKAALTILYTRIKNIVENMNGTCRETELPSSLSDQMSDGPSNLSSTGLHVELLNGLVVDFQPQNPLGIGNALSVNARRVLPGSGTFGDIGFSFVNSEWQAGRKTLTDEAIRECLTPNSPVPIY